ncbi:hydroxycarboxylic acid receptor 2-like [Festucalex cinctus]
MANGSIYQLIEDCEATHKGLYKFYAAVMIVIVMLALPLNMSVLHLFIFKLKFWKSNSNNVFLFNLVLADMLLLFSLPIKSYNYIQGRAYLSGLTLVFRVSRQDVADSLREAVFFTQILIPFAILVYCTVHIVNRLRKKTVGDKTKLRRAVFLVTSVMVVFSLCFLPCTIARVVLLVARVEEWPESSQDKAAVAFDGLMVLSYLDCLLDPLVYCFCSTKFKALYVSNYFPFLLKDGPLPMDSSTGNATSNPKRNDVI